MSVGLSVGVWVARYLGPGNYGQLSYALAFVALFSSFSNLGLDNITVRNIVRDPTKRDQILGTVFVLRLVGGTFAFFATIGAILFLRPGDHVSHWLVGIVAVGMIFQSFDAIDYWFKSQLLAKYSVIAKSSAILVVGLVKIVLIYKEASLLAFAWVGCAEIFLGSLGLVIAYKYSGGFLAAWRAHLTVAKELLRDSWPLIFSGIVSMIYLRIDQVMLGQIEDDQEVGWYSAAVRLAEMWYFIPMAISSSVYPSIVKARQESEELFYLRLQKFYNLVAFIGYAVALVMTFASEWVIQLLFGEAYAESGPMLAVLIWAGLFVNLGVARSSFLMSMNWTKVHLLTVFLGSIVNVGLNLTLIPRYGGMGAVIASCVAYWVAAHGSCYFYKPLFRTGNMITKAICCPKVW